MQPEKIAPGVYYLPSHIANAYALGEPGGPWILVDSCTPGHFESIRGACEEIYGEDARPEAIILTHGHLDHYGSVQALATYWDVLIYAHRLDLPYLTGKSKMPPSDPTTLGFMAFASRFLPDSGTDLGDSIRPLPEEGVVPGAPDWKWFATPGHTPGHISLFRERDRALIAGDAVLTMDADKMTDTLTRKPELARPPSPATYDWIAARKSMLFLATLQPTLVASGHGVPMNDLRIAEKLERFSENVIIPLHGRYVAEPAVTDENGIVYLPPPAPDPYKKAAIGVGIAAVVGAGFYLLASRRSEKDKKVVASTEPEGEKS